MTNGHSDETASPEQGDYDGHPRHTGLRPTFHALWHLKELGVVRDLEDYASAAWDKAKAKGKVTVALIDTLVAHDHPNLTDAIDRGRMRDFTKSATGRFVSGEVDGADKERRRVLLAKLKSLEEAERKEGTQAWYILQELDELGEMTDLKAAAKADPTTIKPADKERLRHLLRQRGPDNTEFGAHGTAMAGLIGANPVANYPLRLPAKYGIVTEDSKKVDVPLPYAGINPFCLIVPVAVSAAPAPDRLLAAVEYCLLIEPDIVVIADNWFRADPHHAHHHGHEGHAHGANGSVHGNGGEVPHGDLHEHFESDQEPLSTKMKALLHHLEERFKALCNERPVFCAAGNEPLTTLIYPASLSKHVRYLYAVGAGRIEKGSVVDMSYSPRFDAIVEDGHKILRTLSTEHSRYDSTETLFDPFEAYDKELGNPPPDKPPHRVFPPWDVVTTDIPGDKGYNPSPFDHDWLDGSPHDGEIIDLGALYCRFSGTSAAAAIAAGLASLALQIGEDLPAKEKGAKVVDFFNLRMALEKFKTSPPADLDQPVPNAAE